MIRYVIFLLLLTPLWSSAQPLTSKEYVAEVMDYSLSLKVSESEIAQSAATLSVARTARLPELSASGRLYYHLRHNEGVKPWNLLVEPLLVQTLYGGGVVSATVDQAKLGVTMAQRTSEYTLLEVIYAARSAYWNYWGMYHYCTAMREYVTIINREYDAINHRYDEGYTSKGDLLMIAVRLSEAEFELASAERSLNVAQHNLNTLRGYSPDDSIMLTSDVIKEFDLPQRIDLDMLMYQRPDYMAMLIAEGIAQANIRAVRGSYNPTIVGGVSGSWLTRTPNIDGSTFMDGVLFVEMSVPIFNFSKRRKSVAVAREELLQSELQTNLLRDQIVLDESNAWSTLSEGYSQMMIARGSLDMASENLEISTYSYNEGLVSIVDLMQAQISWIQLYTNAINSQYAYQLSKAEYWRVTGEKFK